MPVVRVLQAAAGGADVGGHLGPQLGDGLRDPLSAANGENVTPAVGKQRPFPPPPLADRTGARCPHHYRLA